MALKRQAPYCFHTLGLGGGKSRAVTVSEKPTRLWLPSQNGLFAEWPQRQSVIVVRPPSPNAWPIGSRISKSPSTRMEPLFCTVIFVVGISRIVSCAFNGRARAGHVTMGKVPFNLRSSFGKNHPERTESG